MINDIFIVSSHYNENIRWLSEQSKHNFVVYTKNQSDAQHQIDFSRIRKLDNRGREASSYLAYIIDEYENLPEVIAFCHGHEHSWHQDRHIMDAIASYDGSRYYSLNNPFHRNRLIDGCGPDTFPVWEKIKKHAPDLGISLPETLEHTMAAQFITTRECIISNSKNFYQNCLSWLLTQNELDDWLAAVIFEQLWFFLMTKESVEPKRLNVTSLSSKGYIE